MLHAEIRPARGGRIAWPGLGDPRSVWELRSYIALVSAEFQARYRYPTRVFDAVASGFHSSIGLVRKLTDEQNDRVAALLADFELKAFGDRLLATLSYGQRHRALIARTFVTDPKILLLDEPWEGLDSETSEIIAQQIDRRIAAGSQVVCVSHVGPRGLSVNRRMTLADGRIAYAGDSVEPRENSANARSPATNSRQR
jgi:ABC-type molybdenum transport system ATPase subunit/photorepair protein PhrA